jgi:hypothetical protein
MHLRIISKSVVRKGIGIVDVGIKWMNFQKAKVAKVQ